MAEILINELTKLDIKVVTHKTNHFDTVSINIKDSGFTSSDFILAEFHKFGINLGKVDEETVSIAFNETTTMYDLDEVIEIFADLKGKRTTFNYMPDTFYEGMLYKGVPTNLKRTSEFMTQP
jgi:glycine cleavage system pyridoxal-binding protein P